MEISIIYHFEWWHIPVLLFTVFAVTYISTATKLIATNDHKKGKQ